MENQEQLKEQKQRGRKSASLLLLLILLVTITVGFAVLSTTLAIKGSSTIKGGTAWCVGPQCDDQCEDAENPSCGIIVCPASEDCEIVDCNTHPDHCTCDSVSNTCTPDPIDCSVTPEKCKKPNCTVTATEDCVCTASDTNCTPNPLIWMDGDTIYFDHTLEKPGDVFTFNAKYANTGDIDAKVKNLNKTEMNSTAQQYMTYSVTYDDDSAIAVGNELAAGASTYYKVTVAYKSTVTELPDAATLALINETASGRHGAYSSFEVNYEQK